MVKALMCGVLLMSAVAPAQDTETFIATVTDSTCANADHSQMRMGPPSDAPPEEA